MHVPFELLFQPNVDRRHSLYCQPSCHTVYRFWRAFSRTCVLSTHHLNIPHIMRITYDIFYCYVTHTPIHTHTHSYTHSNTHSKTIVFFIRTPATSIRFKVASCPGGCYCFAIALRYATVRFKKVQPSSIKNRMQQSEKMVNYFENG